MGIRSNLFANIENKFEFADKEEITATAFSSLGEIIEALEGKDGFGDKFLFAIMILGAKLGVAGDGIINDQEKELIEEVFGRIWNGSIDEIYELIGTEIEDSDYTLVEVLTQLGNVVAMPFLNYVLSFAYIDGEIEDDVAERLDNLFGMNLMVDFFQSGLEEVPTPKIRIKFSEFEVEIVKWFQSDDQVRPFDDIAAHFPEKSRDEVQKVLDSLVDKSVLYGGVNLAFNSYLIAPEWIESEFQ